MSEEFLAKRIRTNRKRWRKYWNRMCRQMWKEEMEDLGANDPWAGLYAFYGEAIFSGKY